MANSTKCLICGKPKKSWYKLCYECNEKEKQKPTCEICGIEVPQGHFLCNKHWKERMDEKKDLNKIKYVKSKKEKEFKEKFEGKYYFNSMKIKSKSELLICYFLFANGINMRVSSGFFTVNENSLSWECHFNAFLFKSFFYGEIYLLLCISIFGVIFSF